MKHTTSIKKNHIFKRLYGKGNSYVTPFFAMYLMKNGKNAKEENFLGITVGVKLGNAVVRNKVRRRIREMYRIHESQLKQGFQIVIVARNRCATASYQQMEESFLQLCNELGLSCSDFPVRPLRKKFPSSGGKPTGGKGKNPSFSTKTKNPDSAKGVQGLKPTKGSESVVEKAEKVKLQAKEKKQGEDL